MHELASGRTLPADSAAFRVVWEAGTSDVTRRNPFAATADAATGQRRGMVWTERYLLADGAVFGVKPLEANFPVSARRATSSR